MISETAARTPLFPLRCLPMSKQNSSFRKRKKSPIGLIIMGFIILAVILTGAGTAMYLSANSARNVIEETNIPLTCYVSGDDLIVTLQDAGRTQEIISIEVILDGYTIPPGYSIQLVPRETGVKKIVYLNLASGIDGEVQVIFRARFTDESEKTIWAEKIAFI